MKIFRLLSVAISLIAGLQDLKELLGRLAANDYAGAWADLKAQPVVLGILGRLSAEEQAACDLAGPLVMRALDAIIPEEKILAAM